MPKDFLSGHLTEHCRNCNVTLCTEVCWKFFHAGVGLDGKVTIEDYKRKKKESANWRAGHTPVYMQRELPLYPTTAFSPASKDVTPVYET